ncbi:MAG: hypothetical protein E7378_00205 [Clostridiales bacterium]|nr:hypothetical protein [Clostridiales bacterium]
MENNKKTIDKKKVGIVAIAGFSVSIFAWVIGIFFGLFGLIPAGIAFTLSFVANKLTKEHNKIKAFAVSGLIISIAAILFDAFYALFVTYTVGTVFSTILYVIIAIIVLLTMVLIHELGHYIVGRKLGFTILEFSIGFGKVLWQKTNKRGEKISIRLFPLGGFCSFLGEGDDEEEQSKTDAENKDVVDIKAESNEDNKSDTVEKNDAQPTPETKKVLNENAIVGGGDSNLENIPADDPRRFNNQKPWKRILVFFAGVTFNFLSAFIFSLIFLLVGNYDVLIISPTAELVGETPVSFSYVMQEDELLYGTTYGYSLKENTMVYAIDGTEINYARGRDFTSLIGEKESIKLTIAIDSNKVEVEFGRNFTDKDGNAKFGISEADYIQVNYSFGDALRDFIPFTFELAGLILKAFWSIITGAVAFNQLGGPISTITQMTEVASYGVASFLYLLPLLAANLAIFNILPIPGLDGAHVIFTTIEAIRKKPIKRKVENMIHAIGIMILFAFVILVDVIHLFG